MDNDYESIKREQVLHSLKEGDTYASTLAILQREIVQAVLCSSAANGLQP